MKPYKIKTIESYPDNGNHQECIIDLPFQIRKGEDGFYYTNAKGKQCKYNLNKNLDKIDKRWIVFLTSKTFKALNNIFNIKTNKDLEKIIKYCVKIYKKSLELEIERLQKEFDEYI